MIVVFIVEESLESLVIEEEEIRVILVMKEEEEVARLESVQVQT